MSASGIWYRCILLEKKVIQIDINYPEMSFEPKEPLIYGYCDYCDGEIYDGDECYEIMGYEVHEDCIEDFCKEKYGRKFTASVDF